MLIFGKRLPPYLEKKIRQISGQDRVEVKKCERGQNI